MSYPTKRLGEVCEVVGGGTPSTFISEYWSGNIVWITPKDMGKLDSYEIVGSNKKITEAGLKNSSAKLLPKGAVVLSSRAPIGYVAIADVPLATNQGCRSFICDESKIYNRYLLHFLLTKTELLNHLGGGSTFKEISGSKLKELEIPLPPIAEQKKIVARLEGLLRMTKEAKRLRAEAEEAAQNLLPAELHHIFTPTPHKQYPYKLENVRMSSKPASVKTSADKWEEKELGEICELNMGQSPASSTYNGNQNGLPFYQGKKDYGEKYPTPRVWCSNPIKIVEAGDILISVRAPVGALNIAREKSCIGRGLAGLRAKKELDQAFLFRYLQLKEKDISALGTGSTFTAISKKHLENLVIPLPSIAEQKKIVARLDSLSEKIRILRQAQAKTATDFTALEQSVLHQAFN